MTRLRHPPTRARAHSAGGACLISGQQEAALQPLGFCPWVSEQSLTEFCPRPREGWGFCQGRRVESGNVFALLVVPWASAGWKGTDWQQHEDASLGGRLWAGRRGRWGEPRAATGGSCRADGGQTGPGRSPEGHSQGPQASRCPQLRGHQGTGVGSVGWSEVPGPLQRCQGPPRPAAPPAWRGRGWSLVWTGSTPHGTTAWPMALSLKEGCGSGAQVPSSYTVCGQAVSFLVAIAVRCWAKGTAGLDPTGLWENPLKVGSSGHP